MKIKGLLGEFAFKALYKGVLSERYFKTFIEAQNAFDETVIWPIEVYDNGTVYIPAQEELQNEN